MKAQRRIERDRARRQRRTCAPEAKAPDDADDTDASIEQDVDLRVARRLLGYDV